MYKICNKIDYDSKDWLNYIEADETSDQRRTVILFLAPSVTAPIKKLGPFSVPMLPTSGKGRLYASSVYPKNKERELYTALRKFAPHSVRIEFYNEALFDRKNGTDRFGCL